MAYWPRGMVGLCDTSCTASHKPLFRLVGGSESRGAAAAHVAAASMFMSSTVLPSSIFGVALWSGVDGKHGIDLGHLEAWVVLAVGLIVTTPEPDDGGHHLHCFLPSFLKPQHAPSFASACTANSFGSNCNNVTGPDWDSRSAHAPACQG
jgi:hypothetical protein